MVKVLLFSTFFTHIYKEYAKIWIWKVYFLKINNVREACLFEILGFTVSEPSGPDPSESGAGGRIKPLGGRRLVFMASFVLFLGSNRTKSQLCFIYSTCGHRSAEQHHSSLQVIHHNNIKVIISVSDLYQTRFDRYKFTATNCFTVSLCKFTWSPWEPAMSLQSPWCPPAAGLHPEIIMFGSLFPCELSD